MPDDDLKNLEKETEATAAQVAPAPEAKLKPPVARRIAMEMMVVSNGDDDPIITIQQAQRGFYRTIWIDDFGYWSIQYYLQKFYEFLQEDSASDILIMVNSYGGAVGALLSLLDAIKASPVDVRTCAIGPAMSCGAILLSAGTKGKRYCIPHSTVMIHQISGVVWGNISDVENDVEEMRRINEIAMTILAENCGMTFKELMQIFEAAPNGKREFYFDAAGAKQFGLIDEVTEKLFDIIPQKAKKETATEVNSDGQ